MRTQKRKATGGNKPRSTLPSPIEMTAKEYELLIKGATIEVYRNLTEPDKAFENGRVDNYYYESYVEVRKVNHHLAFNFYVYSSFNSKLWATKSFEKAGLIFRKALNTCNREIKWLNELGRKNSIKRAREEKKGGQHEKS